MSKQVDIEQGGAGDGADNAPGGLLPQRDWTDPSIRKALGLSAVKGEVQTGVDHEDGDDHDPEADDPDTETEEPEDEDAEGDEPETDEAEGEEEPEEEGEEEEPEDEEEIPGQRKFLKRINKLTARAKTAETQLEALKAELAEAKANGGGVVPGGDELPRVRLIPQGTIPTPQELATAEAETRRTIEWCRRHADGGFPKVDQSGEPLMDDDGEPLVWTREEIRDIRDAARDDLQEGIPAFRGFLAARDAATKEAAKAFPELAGDPGKLAQIRATAFQVFPSLRGKPDADFLATALVVGLKVANGQLKTVKAGKPATAQPAKAGTPGLKQPLKRELKPLAGNGTTGSAKAALGAEAQARKELAQKQTPEAFANWREAQRKAQARMAAV